MLYARQYTIYSLTLIWIYIHNALIATAQEMTIAQHKFLRLGAQKRLKERQDHIARLVQLTFHDCVGGCDGCVDLKDHGNVGLEETYDWVKSFRNDYASYLSLADVMVFVGIEALKIASIRANNTVFVPYSIGRKDCDSSQGMPKRNLPGHTLLDGVSYLKDTFDLNTKEAVALLGCHSLGSCHRNRSGFHGDWDARPQTIDSGFYLNLASNDWIIQNNTNENINSSSWIRPDSNFIMLHADMTMLKNYTVSGELDTPSCTEVKDCPDADTKEIVFNYARNEAEFIKDLGVAFHKMVDFGQKDLKQITLG